MHHQAFAKQLKMLGKQ